MELTTWRASLATRAVDVMDRHSGRNLVLVTRRLLDTKGRILEAITALALDVDVHPVVWSLKR